MHTKLHGHQQQGFRPLQDTGSRNRTEPATQYTYVHNYTYIPPCTYIIGPSSPKSLSITKAFQDGIELNWLPPTEPNGEVHYVIYYTPEGGTEQSIDTGSNLTHYNMTGLERNRVYTNIAVQAVNSAGRSGRSTVIARYNHRPLASPTTGEQTSERSYSECNSHTYVAICM